MDLLRERVALLGDDRAHVRGEHPHVGHQGGRREDEPRVVWEVGGGGALAEMPTSPFLHQKVKDS